MTTAIETTIATRTEHELPSSLLQKKVQVTVVGCGGTGSAIAAGLPYLHQAMVALGHRHGLDVILVDGDRISRTNCVRQPFSERERDRIALTAFFFLFLGYSESDECARVRESANWTHNLPSCRSGPMASKGKSRDVLPDFRVATIELCGNEVFHVERSTA
jgi:hypothetical protein